MTKELQCAKRLAEGVDARDFLHVETAHLTAIGESSLTTERITVEDPDLESDAVPIACCSS